MWINVCRVYLKDLCLRTPRNPGSWEMKQEIPTSDSSMVVIAVRVLMEVAMLV